METEISEDIQRFHDYLDEIRRRIDRTKTEFQSERAVEKTAEFSTDKTLDTIRHTTLRLRCEIESLMSSSPVLLPDDKEIILNITNDQSVKADIESAHSLAYMRDKAANLERVKRVYEDMLKNSEAVDTFLTEIINGRDAKDYLAQLKIRHQNYGEIFVELRTELGWYLNTRFPPTSSDQLSLEELLESLTSKFLEDQNDPYIDYNPEVIKLEAVEFLIRCNLVSRHPSNFLKLRLRDLRRK